MTLYFLKYCINESSRSECTTLFGGMTTDDDKRDMGSDIDMLGRWSTVGSSSGFCICESQSASELHNWLLNWSNMATIECYPVVDDNCAREIILGKEPTFKVDYSKVGDSAKDGESLFVIEYKFMDSKRSEGYNLFANMSEDYDLKDSGHNTCYGRWHNLGNGTGIAVCSSKSEKDLYSWAFNWKDLCTCVIQPVVNDDDCRNNIRLKPDFLSKHSQLLSKLYPKKGWLFGGSYF